MKVSLKTAEDCIGIYISKEICPKLEDFRKWAIPMGMGMLMPQIEKKFYDYKDFLVSAGFVDSDNNIDVDLLYKTFHSIAVEKGDIKQNIPLLGDVTFSAKDIEEMYHIITTNGNAVPQYNLPQMSSNSTVNGIYNAPNSNSMTPLQQNSINGQSMNMNQFNGVYGGVQQPTIPSQQQPIQQSCQPTRAF